MRRRARECGPLRHSSRPGGVSCKAWPQAGRDFCFFHDPERAEDLSRAQQLGGMRRTREKTSAVVYDLQGFSSADDAQRILEIALMDTLTLDNSIARNRVLGYLSQVLLKSFEVRDVAERLAKLEAEWGRASGRE